MIKKCIVGMLASGVFVFASFAQNNNQGGDGAIAGIEKYRQALADANPAELWEARGEEMWKQPAGPKAASFEKCDLGLGAGVVKGAYAALPKYFADTDKVQDLESRLVTCMGTLQGIAAADATKVVFGSSGVKTDMEALVAYISGESRGMPLKISLAHPKEKIAYEIGRKMFFYRGGTHDFGCVTCHGADNSRIRLQDLPNLSKQEPARRAYTTWPAYRVSQGEVRSFQWRLFDCFRQQRFPQLAFGSEGSVALTMFLAYNANGGKLDAPAIKR
jgi:L-cysteine S-thiosulfotransferase